MLNNTNISVSKEPKSPEKNVGLLSLHIPLTVRDQNQILKSITFVASDNQAHRRPSFLRESCHRYFSNCWY